MPTDAKDCPLIFVNSVEVQGSLNGVCNVLLAQARFVPEGEGKVGVEKSFVADLRFDLFVAQNLHDALGALLADQVKPAAKEVN